MGKEARQRLAHRSDIGASEPSRSRSIELDIKVKGQPQSTEYFWYRRVVRLQNDVVWRAGEADFGSAAAATHAPRQ